MTIISLVPSCTAFNDYLCILLSLTVGSEGSLAVTIIVYSTIPTKNVKYAIVRSAATMTTSVSCSLIASVATKDMMSITKTIKINAVTIQDRI